MNTSRISVHCLHAHAVVDIHTHKALSETTTTTSRFPARVPLSVCCLHENSLMLSVMDVASAPSAARRRREGRLRQFLRHEGPTVAMALAEKLHHTSRGQKIARARREENEMNFATGQTTPPPRAAAAVYHPLTLGAEAGGVLAAGGRPSPLIEVRPQGGSAAHRGAFCRRLALRADSRCSCSADG